MIRYKKKLVLAKFWKKDYGARQIETSEEKKKHFKRQRFLVGWLWEKGKSGEGTHFRHCYPVSQTCMNWKSDYLA